MRYRQALPIALLIWLLVMPAPAMSAHGQTLLISRASGLSGVGSDDEADHPSISGTGRFVAFGSLADNLSTADNNSFNNVFVRDVQAGTTTLLSRNALQGANDHSGAASMSADGRFVAFVSDADNLSTADNNSVYNVFVQQAQFDRAARAPTLVSRANGVGGAGGDGNSFEPSISADGRFVAFESGADNLSTADNDNFGDVFVRDVQANTLTLVSRNDVTGGNDHSQNPSISADGRFVAFESKADNLSTGDNNSVTNIFVQDVTSPGVPTLMSRNDVAGADDDSRDPSISADGRLVAFQSRANNLSTADNKNFGDVFVRDTQAGTTTLMSRTSGASGFGGDSGSFSPALSADGLQVAFTSNADNLSTADNNAVTNVFRRDVHLGTALRPGRCVNPIQGTNGGETLTGTRTGDRILGLGGSDVLRGLRGDDCIAGGRGRDRLVGGAGRDRLAGNSGNDRLSGGSGRDRLAGGSGRDRLSGGSGRDRIKGGKGRDRVKGGSGRDRINVRGGGEDRIDCGRGHDRVKADASDVVSDNCEVVEVS